MIAHAFRATNAPFPGCQRCRHCFLRRDVIEMRSPAHPFRVACPRANPQHFCGATNGTEYIDGQHVGIGGCELPAGHWDESDVAARHAHHRKDGKTLSFWGASRACEDAAWGLERPRVSIGGQVEEARSSDRRRDAVAEGEHSRMGLDQ